MSSQSVWNFAIEIELIFPRYWSLSSKVILLMLGTGICCCVGICSKFRKTGANLERSFRTFSSLQFLENRNKSALQRISNTKLGSYLIKKFTFWFFRFNHRCWLLILLNLYFQAEARRPIGQHSSILENNCLHVQCSAVHFIYSRVNVMHAKPLKVNYTMPKLMFIL